jgi:uncharacterized repeat protein (TIGR01451 family)
VIRTVTPAPRAVYAPPACGPAALLYVRFLGSAGMKVTLYQGQQAGRTLPVPFTAGLRPGYIYRVRVSGLPGHPGAILYPSLEVRGTLALAPELKAADYPAPVEITEADFRSITAGAVVTKVLVLEHPEKAVPMPSRPEQPVEAEVAPGQDPVHEAVNRGRPVLIVRIGQRQFSPEELAHQAIPGTVWLPGDNGLPPPACRPWVPWCGAPLYDPLVGPRKPEEECLRDGGDHGQPAGIDAEGRLQGLDPADTVAEYADARGRRHVAVSNCVCLCVPRFLVVRGETNLAAYIRLVGPEDTLNVYGQEAFQTRLRVGDTRQAEQLKALHGRERPSGTFNAVAPGRLFRLEVLNAHRIVMGPGEYLGTKYLDRLTRRQRTLLERQMELARQLGQPYGLEELGRNQPGPAAVGRVHGVNVIGTLQEVRSITVACNEAPVPPSPAKPLVLHKWADRKCAKVGDVVTFFLKYSNVGGEPITDVAISDSLTNRLEYIPGSAKADRDAVFTIQDNEAGSVILRWEIGGRLLPGQSGVVSFQARVR